MNSQQALGAVLAMGSYAGSISGHSYRKIGSQVVNRRREANRRKRVQKRHMRRMAGGRK